MHARKGSLLTSPQLPKNMVLRQRHLLLNWDPALWRVAGGRAKGLSFRCHT